jgi:tRNA(Phe) wybutosine-synthesizing methylase Tyw3
MISRQNYHQLAACSGRLAFYHAQAIGQGAGLDAARVAHQMLDARYDLLTARKQACAAHAFKLAA